MCALLLNAIWQGIFLSLNGEKYLRMDPVKFVEESPEKFEVIWSA